MIRGAGPSVDVAAVAVASGVTSALGVALFEAPYADSTGDAAHYPAMAAGETAPAPFGYRILVPRVAGLLPWSNELGFELLTVVGISLTASLCYVWLRRREARHLAAAGIALLLASGPAAMLYRHPHLTDAFAWAVIAAVLVLADTRRWIIVGSVAAVGVLVRETTVLILVVPAIAAARTAGWRQTMAVVGPPAVALLLLRVSPFFGTSGLPDEPFDTPAEVFEYQAR